MKRMQWLSLKAYLKKIKQLSSITATEGCVGVRQALVSCLQLPADLGGHLVHRDASLMGLGCLLLQHPLSNTDGQRESKRIRAWAVSMSSCVWSGKHSRGPWDA